MSRDLTRLRPRQTIHNGVTMRSRLEAGFAQWCDDHRIEWEYEPCVLSGGGQWLPDFRLPRVLWISADDDPGCEIQEVETFVEVKYEGWDDETELARIARVFEAWDAASDRLWIPRLILARPDGLDEVCPIGRWTEGVTAYYRQPLRVLPCGRRPQGSICLQYEHEVADGPWLGDWWRR